MTDQTNVKISPAKGRPMLHWVGKRPLDYVTAFPAQLVERFAPLDSRSHLPAAGTPLPPSGSPLPSSGTPLPKTGEGPGVRADDGLLFHGDNKDVLAWLLAHGYRGKVHLIYIDPPFDSGADYIRKVSLRGMSTQAIDGESYSLGEQIQYTDIWANDTYLQFMYERFLLLKELLTVNQYLRQNR